MFKAVQNSDRLPRRAWGTEAGRTGFLGLDADGVAVPSDWCAAGTAATPVAASAYQHITAAILHPGVTFRAARPGICAFSAPWRTCGTPVKEDKGQGQQRRQRRP